MKRILGRIALIAGGLIAALIVLLVGMVLVDGFFGPGRLDTITNARIANPRGPEVRAFVARPAAPGKYPAVIMLHEFWGLTPEMTGKARALAEEGYIVIAPDVYRGSATSLVPRAIFQVISNPAAQIDTDLDAVYAWVASQPDVKADRVGIMGFCAGGANSLRYSLSNGRLAATIILYGQVVTDPARLKSLSGSVLGIFGEADTSIPLDGVRAFERGLKTAGIPSKVSIYPGQPHAFVGSIEEIRKGGPSGQAWSEITAFFKATLQSDAPPTRNTAPTQIADAFDLGYWLQVALLHSGHTR
jgi:carboxymethylenebutenolidase